MLPAMTRSGCEPAEPPSPRAPPPPWRRISGRYEKSGLAGFHGAAFALYVYGFQLLLNGLWSVAFFGLRRPDLALFEIVFLWIFINITIVLLVKSTTLPRSFSFPT
jgi:translocator protein